MQQEGLTSLRLSNRCVSSPIFLHFAKTASLDGIPSSLAVIICVRQVAPLSRKWPLLWPMALLMSRQLFGQVLTWIPLPPDSLSSSAAITPSLKRLQNYERPGDSGQK